VSEGMYGIKCNVRAPHRFMRMGALCWVTNINPGSAGEHVEVIGLSRGGRAVSPWMDARDLDNFRVGSTLDERRFLRGRSLDELQAIAADLQNRWSSGPVRPHAAAHGKID
jgi:hypothetical protein